MKTPAKILIVLAVALAVIGAVVLKKDKSSAESSNPSQAVAVIPPAEASSSSQAAPAVPVKLPKLLDLGAGKCIPCKMMAPILEELKKEYAGRMEVVFIDVWQDPDAGKAYGIEMIPTQIFYDAEGKERFRHVGFYGKQDILNKWKELGVDLSGGNPVTAIVRDSPIAADARPRDQVCFLCDETIQPKAKTVVKGLNEQRLLCSPHCYFIYFTSLVGVDPKVEAAKVSVTDWASGSLIPATSATYLYGMDAKGRSTIKAFATRDTASKVQQVDPGNLITWDVLSSKELATRCGFCDRAVYPEDACSVKIGTTHGYGCCTHCSMGVAARLKQDIEVEAKDGLTGDLIRVKTLNGQIASLEPATAVAWFGQIKNAEGKWVSAGCFKQGFFSNPTNLQKWLEARPSMTGRQITIAQALADKMKLSPEQIAKACKLGECK